MRFLIFDTLPSNVRNLSLVGWRRSDIQAAACRSCCWTRHDRSNDLGIDPGAYGATAVLDEAEGLLKVVDTIRKLRLAADLLDMEAMS